LAAEKLSLSQSRFVQLWARDDSKEALKCSHFYRDSLFKSKRAQKEKALDADAVDELRVGVAGGCWWRNDVSYQLQRGQNAQRTHWRRRRLQKGVRERAERERMVSLRRREGREQLLTGDTLHTDNTLDSSTVDSTLACASSALLKSCLGVHAFWLAEPEAALLEVSGAYGAAHTTASESRGVKRLVEEVGSGRSAGEGDSVNEDLALYLLLVRVRTEIDPVIDFLRSDEVVVGHCEDEVVWRGEVKSASASTALLWVGMAPPPPASQNPFLGKHSKNKRETSPSGKAGSSTGWMAMDSARA
jgi:hypothetical protein